MSDYQTRMFSYSGDNLEICHRPTLQDGQNPVVLVVHDESCFSSHDGKKTIWMEADRQPLRPKGQGRSIMVSGFLCECHGRLKLTSDLQILHPNLPVDAQVLIRPGAGADGYWTNADLVNQLKERALPIFKALHPGCDALFAFDNSQNHRARAPDALIASRLNVSDGGKSVKPTRPGCFIDKDGQKPVSSERPWHYVILRTDPAHGRYAGEKLAPDKGTC
jgi:hypothetical protein